MITCVILKAGEVNMFGTMYSAETLKELADGKTKIWNEELKQLEMSINYSKIFSERYGGKWKYDGCCSWLSGKRRISRVAGCTCDDFCNHPSRYYLY